MRRWRDLPRFLLTSRACSEQARRDLACLGGATYVGPGLTFWTATIWEDEAAARKYVRTPPHLPAMKYLAEWCSEAATGQLAVSAAELPERTAMPGLVAAHAKFFPVKAPSESQRDKEIPPQAPRSQWLFKPAPRSAGA